MKGLIEHQDRDRLLQLLTEQSRLLEMLTEDVALPTVLEQMMRALETQADGMLCSVLLLSEDGQRLNLGAAPSLPEGYRVLANGVTIGPDEGSCGTAAWSRQQVIVTDIMSDRRWVRYKHVAATYGLGACWSTPIVSKRGDFLGIFAIYYRQPTSPTPLHFALIEMATHLTAIAIEQRRAARERERLVEELKSAVRTRDEFLSIASHELRTPLTSLKLQVQLALAVLTDAEPLIRRDRSATGQSSSTRW
jgi:GAF domain-containing protein